MLSSPVVVPKSADCVKTWSHACLQRRRRCWHLRRREPCRSAPAVAVASAAAAAAAAEAVIRDALMHRLPSLVSQWHIATNFRSAFIAKSNLCSYTVTWAMLHQLHENGASVVRFINSQNCLFLVVVRELESTVDCLIMGLTVFVHATL